VSPTLEQLDERTARLESDLERLTQQVTRLAKLAEASERDRLREELRAELQGRPSLGFVGEVVSLAGTKGGVSILLTAASLWLGPEFADALKDARSGLPIVVEAPEPQPVGGPVPEPR